MSLSPRQWIVLLVLIVGFGLAALAVRGDGGGPASPPPIDEVAWCREAGGLSGTGDLFTGERIAATATDFEAAKDAVYAVEILAPWTLRPDLPRLADFALVTVQQFDEVGWPAAFAAARTQVDTAAVDQVVDALDQEMTRCGLTLHPLP